MTYIIRLFQGQTIFGSRIVVIALVVLGTIAMQSRPVHAQWTTNGNNVNNTNTGNVGIGTTTPFVRLTTTGASGAAIGNGFDGILQLTTGTGGQTDEKLAIGIVDGSSGYVWFQAYKAGSYAKNMVLAPLGGNVGIGASTPNSSYKLDVNGNTNVTGDITVTGTGNINASGAITGGTINAKYQDVAEWVESSQALTAGTVVVLDHTRSNQVIASSQAYDTRVAGVISLQPGITLGENGAGKVLVATTGRVKIKVDATAGPIQIGDLLVTSDKEGIAKKSEPLSLGGVQIHRPGTLIGKALEPLERGSGTILVLLSLQ